MSQLIVWMLTEDTVPKDDDVVAGPWGALMFVLLIGATIFLCFSFVKQLRKTRANRDAGAFGPVEDPGHVDAPDDDRA